MGQLPFPVQLTMGRVEGGGGLNMIAETLSCGQGGISGRRLDGQKPKWVFIVQTTTIASLKKSLCLMELVLRS